MAKRKSIELIRNFNRARKTLSKAEEHFYCWKIEKLGMKYTDEERARMHEAQSKLSEAEEIARKVFGERIGKEIMTELYSNDWDDA